MAEAGGWKQGLCNCCGDCGICEYSNLKSFDRFLVEKKTNYKEAQNVFSTTADEGFFPGCCASFCNPCLTYTTANDLGKVFLFSSLSFLFRQI